MNTQIKKWTQLSILTCLLAGALVGCNTIEGAGRDIEKAGEEIQEEARG